MCALVLCVLGAGAAMASGGSIALHGWAAGLGDRWVMCAMGRGEGG